VRKIFAVFLLLGCGSAQAEVITLDLEDLASVTGPADACLFGCTFGDFVTQANYLSIHEFPSNSALKLSRDGGAPGFSIVPQQDASFDAFAVLSFDVLRVSDGFYLQGYDVPVGEWTTVTVENPAYGTIFGIGAYSSPISAGGTLFIDNIIVSTVPIPATVWLFGSGLAMLGWMKRRHN
jgi:hypothetical protein